jgi:hypothetical protein
MSKITVVLAGDKNYKPFVEKGKKITEALGYPVSVYDLGGLGFGTPFAGRFTDEPNAKIPCKPRIILEELKKTIKLRSNIEEKERVRLGISRNQTLYLQNYKIRFKKPNG